MPSLRTILYPQRSPTEPYSIKIDPSELVNPTQRVLNTTLVEQVNQELYDLTIIKNSRLLDSYKNTIRYLVDQKKVDIQEVSDYIKQRDTEAEEYKRQIEELTKDVEDKQASIPDEPTEDTIETAEDIPETTEATEDTEDTIDDDTKDLDCSIEQLLRRQLDRTKITYDLEVISISRPFSLVLIVGEITILLEITSTSRNTTDSTINSFKARVKASEATCGMFISMEQGYTIKSGISDFSLINSDDKYLLFLAKLENDHYKFKNAVNILVQLTQKKNNESA